MCMDTVILDFGDGKQKKLTKADIERTERIWEEKQKKLQDRNGGAWGTVAKK